ncbi:MAG: integration host factor subunit alpha [Desulfobacteraceae bacterium]|nr:integration host factor subunit alpha [Desulfobacteraceae bacterium]
MALTKTGIISTISELAGIDRKLSEQSLEKIIEIIKSTLESGEDVLVSGFGKFCVDQKEMRKGRNPATGEYMVLPARKVVTFKSSGLLKEWINKKTK